MYRFKMKIEFIKKGTYLCGDTDTSMLMTSWFFLCAFEYFSGSFTKLGGCGLSKFNLTLAYLSPLINMSSSNSNFCFLSYDFLNRSTIFAYPFGIYFATSFSRIYSRWSRISITCSFAIVLWISILELDLLFPRDDYGYFTPMPYRLAFLGSSGLILGLKEHDSYSSSSNWTRDKAPFPGFRKLPLGVSPCFDCANSSTPMVFRVWSWAELSVKYYYDSSCLLGWAFLYFEAILELTFVLGENVHSSRSFYLPNSLYVFIFYWNFSS